ncbi:hypothetical protein [Comamonas thiooxydans]|uniref:hypothetical protein n=1 Tax=Comamonas thiooxydans TaxID=363952 RepID=UPI00057A7959|nr:hypothetical protein [Comamonas thiooxydans]
MPTYANVNMPPPSSWDEFEDLVCSAAKNRWKSANFTRHGRQGQRQDGVDIYGKDDRGHLVGLQCKNTSSGITSRIVDEEIAKAEAFRPQLHHLYIATTAETEKSLQEFVRERSNTRMQAGDFEVSILFWTDVWQDLTLDESRLFQHYPQLRPTPIAASSGPSHDQRLYAELKSTFGFEPAVRLLRDHDFGGPFLHVSIRPLYNFYETWDQPEKEFIDPELQAGLLELYRAAANLSDHLVGKTVPVGNGGHLSVFSDNLRAAGPRPQWVIDEARILNEEATKFVPIYEKFMRLCRSKLNN